jgi:hypothetical protein
MGWVAAITTLMAFGVTLPSVMAWTGTGNQPVEARIHGAD